MKKLLTFLEKAAQLRTQAARALRLALGLSPDDQERLNQFAEELREQAAELERQAAAETPQRPSEPDRNSTLDEQNPKKGRGGSNDPEPQS
jgi:hypothetical protein